MCITLWFVAIVVTHDRRHQRGTKDHPILLYDSSDDGEVYYQEDKGSTGALNIKNWFNLMMKYRKEIDSLKKINSAVFLKKI